MNASLPEDLKAFVDAQVERGGYGSTSEFVRDLIRRERDRQRLRAAPRGCVLARRTDGGPGLLLGVAIASRLDGLNEVAQRQAHLRARAASDVEMHSHTYAGPPATRLRWRVLHSSRDIPAAFDSAD